MGKTVFDQINYDHGRRAVFYILLKTVLEYLEYKAVPLGEVTIEVQSTKIPRGTGRSIKSSSDNSGRKRCIIMHKKFRHDVSCACNHNGSCEYQQRQVDGFAA